MARVSMTGLSVWSALEFFFALSFKVALITHPVVPLRVSGLTWLELAERHPSFWRGFGSALFSGSVRLLYCLLC